MLVGLHSAKGGRPPGGSVARAARRVALVLGVLLGGCGGGDAAPEAEKSAPAPPQVSVGPALVRNVVLISIDTLRADRLEAYGYPRPTSPNLKALGQRSVIFRRAQAQSAQTAPSHAALLTSEYGETHGLINVHGDSSRMRTLPEGLTTLAEVATQGGIETAAFVSNGNLTRGMGLNRGFAVWDERNEDVGLRVDALLEWMRAPERQRFLTLLHTYQVHAPYVPPKEDAERFVDPQYSGPLLARLQRYWTMSWEKQWAGGVGSDYWDGMLDYTKEDVRFLSDLYDGEIAYTDNVLRKLFQELLTGERSKDTALIVLTDHGEEFHDHGKFQHDQVFEELIHVPLLISIPEAVTQMPWTGDVTAPVELVDIAPTIAELLGLDARASGWDGRSLVAMLDPLRRAGAVDKDRAQFSELTLDPGPKQFRSVTWHGWKYIYGHQTDLDATWEWLFDLNTDPGERTDRMKDKEGEAVEMLATLRRRLEEHSMQCLEQAAAAGRSEAVTVSDELRQSLEQLGYVGEAR